MINQPPDPVYRDDFAKPFPGYGEGAAGCVVLHQNDVQTKATGSLHTT